MDQHLLECVWNNERTPLHEDSTAAPWPADFQQLPQLDLEHGSTSNLNTIGYSESAVPNTALQSSLSTTEIDVTGPASSDPLTIFIQWPVSPGEEACTPVVEPASPTQARSNTVSSKSHTVSNPDRRSHRRNSSKASTQQEPDFERRRAQNRSAQQAFRFRQQCRIADLEAQVTQTTKTESELIQENEELECAIAKVSAANVLLHHELVRHRIIILLRRLGVLMCSCSGEQEEEPEITLETACSHCSRVDVRKLLPSFPAPLQSKDTPRLHEEKQDTAHEERQGSAECARTDESPGACCRDLGEVTES